MQERWRPIAAIVASFVVLVGVARCGSGMPVYDPESASMSGSATSTATASPSASASTTATAGSPSSPSATTSAPAATPGSAETTAQASTIVSGLVTQYSGAVLATGADGAAAREAVLSGRALDAAKARVALAPAMTAEQKADLALKPETVAILAISQGQAYPRSIVATAQSAQTNSPVLLLVQAADAAAGYRIVSQATVLPGAPTVQFPPVAAGSLPGNDGVGLAMTVPDVASAYAASVAFPRPPADARLADDAFSAELLKGARAQASTLSRSGSLTQAHTVVTTPAALRLAAGRGALVFGILDRADTLTETTTNALTPSREFTILSGKTLIDKKAVLTSAEFLVWYVPESGKVTLLAAADQLVGASGS